MKKEKFYYLSEDKKTNIKAVKYLPDDGKFDAIFQIIHGMCEFIDRYDNFAEFLCSKGFMVVGNDILGHGESVDDKENWGYFVDDIDMSHKVVLKDAHNLTEMIKKEYPDKPYFLLGHSMGSFYCQYYMENYGNELNGAIVMGTGRQAPPTLLSGKKLCQVIASRKGWHYRSKLINDMALGSYNKKWEPSRTHCEWLTKDEKICEWYHKEPRCQFVFTVNGYYALFSVIQECINKQKLKKIPQELPILFVSGADDPVGDFSKSVNQVYEQYKALGLHDVSLKLYPNDRHELLNETDKADVYNDIYSWLKAKLTLR